MSVAYAINEAEAKSKTQAEDQQFRNELALKLIPEFKWIPTDDANNKYYNQAAKELWKAVDAIIANRP